MLPLRDHPLMSYRGVNNWPPAWTWRGGLKEGPDTLPRGEIGTLKEVFLSRVEPHVRIYLISEHRDAEYMGCLFFMDATFCGQVFDLLSAHRGAPIADIGKLDVSHLA